MSTSSEIVPKIDTQPYLTQFSSPAQFEQPEQAGQAEIRLEPYFLGHDFIDLPSFYLTLFFVDTSSH